MVNIVLCFLLFKPWRSLIGNDTLSIEFLQPHKRGIKFHKKPCGILRWWESETLK